MQLLSLIILITVLITNLIISIFVIKNNPKSATNRIFFFLAIILSMWVAAMYQVTIPPFSVWMNQLTLFLATPMNIAFLLLAHTLPDTHIKLSKKKLTALIVAGILLMILTSTPYTISGIEIKNNVQSPIPGIGLLIFGIFSISLNIGAVYTLFKRFRKSTGIVREQFRYVMYGILLMFGLLITTMFLPILLFKNGSSIILSPLYTVFFLGMSAYAIIRHRLLDIRLILARAIAFFVFIFLCAGIYSLILFILVNNILKLDIDILTSIIAFSLAVSAAISFQPLLKWLRRITNMIFFKGHYDSDKLLTTLTRIMAQTLDLQYMTTSILGLLAKEMRLEKTALLILNKDNTTEIISIKYEKDLLASAELQKLFIDLERHKDFIFEELPEGKIKNMFRTYDISMAIPIKVENSPIAILVLGSKLSGEVFGSQDIEFLNIFAPQAGIAIQNAKSYEEIKKFNVELEKRVEERTHELKESQERELAKAQDIAKLKDEFVFIASHELRTPVTAIRGFLKMVSNAAKDFPQDVKENLSYMSAASEHLNQLINDLLEISRSEAGTMKIAVQPHSIAPVIQSIMQEVTPQAKQHSITINLEINAKTGLVMIDEKKTKEVIMNILSNAIKYNREKGKVDIRVFPVQDKVAIEVKDNGYGIPKDQQAKIFQKFFRAANKNTEDVLGTGLGLFITRMLVEKMNGEISFTSIENEGTKFTILLPKAQ